MKQFINSMMTDGNGNVSSMRFIAIIVVLAVVAAKFYDAWITKSTISFDQQDFEILGSVLAAKAIQSHAEAKTPDTTPNTASNTSTPAKV